MKRKPTPAQIAARERFAAMARSGAFKKKAKARKANPSAADEAMRRAIQAELAEEARLDKLTRQAEIKADAKRQNAKISQAIFDRVQSGQSVKSAYDAVFGKGAYERLAGELYDEIRKTKSNPRASNPIILVSDKPIASKRKRNPTKRANPMIKYALVPDDGGFTFGMDDRTPVQFVFSNRDKVRGVYRSFALPKSVTSSPDFQQWASSLPGQSIIVSLNDLRKMLKRYV